MPFTEAASSAATVALLLELSAVVLVTAPKELRLNAPRPLVPRVIVSLVAEVSAIPVIPVLEA